MLMFCKNDFLLFVLFCLLFSSCNLSKSNHERLVHELDIEINNATGLIVRETDNEYHELENKLTDPITLDKALNWFPKAKFVRAQTKNILSILENESMDLAKQNDQNECSKALKNYKEEIIKLDEGIARKFNSIFIDLTSPFDSIQIDNQLKKLDFSELSTIENKAFIGKLIYRIRMIENAITEYCNVNAVIIRDVYSLVSC
jgi:hypothetical protein